MSELLQGRYRIEEKIGEGAMGVVYRAEDTRLNRAVALKMIHPDLVKDPEARQRFVREAQAASALAHPNICTIHSIEESDGQLFLVMEFLRGQTLRARADLPHDLQRMLDVAVQIAEGLAEAHQGGILHRDIKSGNILLTERGVVKIMDFGLAKRVGQSARAVTTRGDEVTDTGVSLGTPAYMSPEQALGREVDQRSDIFSVGIVLYEISTGRLPFGGVTGMEVIDSMLHKEPAPPTRLNPELPAEFERIVLKALRKDREERYGSAADLLVDLKRLRREMDSEVLTGAVAERRPPAWKSLLLVLAAVVVLVGATVGSVLLFGPPPPHRRVAVSGRSLLAVMNFENRTGEERYGRYGVGASELLTVELARAAGGRVDLVSSQRLFDVLREMNKQMQALDRTVATEVARRCGARYMLHGELLKLPEAIVLKTELVEVETGRLVSAQRVVGLNDQNLLEKIDELSRLVGEDLKGLK